MASAGDIHSILFKGDILKQPEPKFNPLKRVTRYFPGKIPAYAEQVELGAKTLETEEIVTCTEVAVTSTGSRLKNKLELLNEILSSSSAESDNDPPEMDMAEQRQRKRRRQTIECRILKVNSDSPVHIAETPGNVVNSTMSPKADAELSPLEVESTEEKRERVKRKAVELRKKEEEDLASRKVSKRNGLLEEGNEGEDEDENEDFNERVDTEESDSLSDDDEDEQSSIDCSARPMYVPPCKREYSREEGTMECEETQAMQRKKAEERKAESKRLFQKILKKESEEEQQRKKEMIEAIWSVEDMPDDNDDKNEELEYELWKVREMKRITRDREEKERHQKQAAEIERRRQMTDQQRKEDDKIIDASLPKFEKRSKYTFMQKYYHRGAFFQDKICEEPLYRRDVNLPVGEDAVDKKLVPKPLRLRRGQFGKAGQVKHTHLADVDTTDFTSAWATKNRFHVKNRFSACKDSDLFERPSLKGNIVGKTKT